MFNFWINVRKECDKQNLSLVELAEKSEISYNTIRNAVNRNSTPSIEIAYKLASVLNVSIEYLLTGQTTDDDKIHLLEDKIAEIKKIILE